MDEIKELLEKISEASGAIPVPINITVNFNGDIVAGAPICDACCEDCAEDGEDESVEAEDYSEADLVEKEVYDDMREAYESAAARANALQLVWGSFQQFISTSRLPKEIRDALVAYMTALEKQYLPE